MLGSAIVLIVHFFWTTRHLSHCGIKKRFLKHILLAKKSGADLVKIQTYEEKDISINLKNLNKNYNLKKIVLNNFVDLAERIFVL